MQKLGKYEILAELGHGAMGVVYRARDPFIGRAVALKTINSNLVDRPDLLERFYQEAQSAGKLQHPNIVTIFELGQEKDTPFIAMEYLDGESLEKTILRQTDMPLAVKVGYIVKICQALEYAHKNRVVHRDIKPGNIMVNSEGAVKVVDFGIARLVDFSRTHTNMMIGTPAYMAPELFRKKKADERTDIWAVGVTCYELISYQRPFTGDGYDIISSIMEDEPSAISSLVPDCPAELETVIQRMLRKQAAERYQTMEDVLLDLEPVWNRLKATEAAALAERGRVLYEQGDLLKAQDRLRRARLIDSTNAMAKSLLEKITAEVRRSEIAPKILEHVSRGRGHLQSGQYREAQAEAEAALSLDSHHEAAKGLIAEVEAAVARSQQIEQKLRLTKQRLAEGALDEADSALRQALNLDAENASALDLQRQISAERGRREKRKQLNELLQRARGLWTELKYDECLALIAEGLKTFPGEADLKSLQETARADQAEQKKQAHVAEVRRLMAQQKLPEARKSLETLTREHAGDTTVRNLQTLLAQEEQEQKKKKRLETELASLRSLVSEEKFKEATTRGELLLRDYPQEYEIKDLVEFAKSEVAQQEQKRKEDERATQIRAFMEAGRFREAADAARQAAQEFPKQEMFRNLAAEAERQAKEQHSREKAQREMQQRIQDIRSKIKRAELSDAIDLAQQTLATMGSDTDVTQLLHAAQLEAQERDKKKEERNRQVGLAKTMLAKGDFSGATQLLNQGMATKVIPQNDTQVKLLLSEIAQREDEVRKAEAQRKEEERRLEAQKKAKADTKESRPPDRGVRTGTGEAPRVPPPSVAPDPTVLAPAFNDQATQLASSGARPRPSTPVMTPLPTVPPPVIQTQVRVQEGLAGAAKPGAAALLKKPAVLAAIALLAIGSVYGAVRIIWGKGSGPVQPSAEDLALQTEATQLCNDHKLDECLADWTKLADREGPLRKAASAQVQDLNGKHVKIEQLYAQGMKLLYAEKKYADAAAKFKEVLDMNLWKLEEAGREFDLASKGPTTNPTPLWQALFDEGKSAYARKDYTAAQQNLQQVVRASGVSRDVSNQAKSMLNVIPDRVEQKRDLELAARLEQSGQKQQAKDMFGRVVKAPNGDPELVAEANRQIVAIGTIEPPVGKTNGTKNPPALDYGPVISDVRGLISQGRWDDADTKLSGVPASQPEYNDLLNQIHAGRRTDQDFTQKRSEFVAADATKNKEELRGLRSFFMNEANSGGRHSGDARNVVAQIDTDLSTPDVVKPPPGGNNGNGGTPANNDAAAINSVVQRFAKAYDEGNLGALRAVREYDPRDEKKLPEILSQIKGKGYSLRNCSAPQISGDAALTSCDVVMTKMPGVKPARTNIHLKNFDGQWIIVSSD